MGSWTGETDKFPRKSFPNQKLCPLQNQIVAIYLGDPKILALLQAPELVDTNFYFKWCIVSQALGDDRDLHVEQGSVGFQLALGGFVQLPQRHM